MVEYTKIKTGNGLLQEIKMTIANWIILGFIIITTGLLIFSYIKKNSLMKKICECILIPLFATLNVLVLKESLPDSLHLIKVTLFSLSMVSISTIFLSFENYKPLRIAGRILVVASIICWISLYRTIFFIHKVPLWLTILMTSIYIAGTIIAIVLSGKQELRFYVLFAISFALTAYLHFCSLIFLCFETAGYSIMLFAGTSIFAGLTAFHFINQTKLKTKHAGVIRYGLLVISQVLIACSNILLIR